MVPSPDPTRLAVPKAYVVLAEGYHPNKVAARLIFRALPGPAGAVPADPPAGVRPVAQDDLRQDPPGGAARREEHLHGADARHGGHERRGIEYRIEDFPSSLTPWAARTHHLRAGDKVDACHTSPTPRRFMRADDGDPRRPGGRRSQGRRSRNRGHGVGVTGSAVTESEVKRSRR